MNKKGASISLKIEVNELNDRWSKIIKIKQSHIKTRRTHINTPPSSIPLDIFPMTCPSNTMRNTSQGPRNSLFTSGPTFPLLCVLQSHHPILLQPPQQCVDELWNNFSLPNMLSCVVQKPILISNPQIYVRLKESNSIMIHCKHQTPRLHSALYNYKIHLSFMYMWLS